MHDYLLTQAQAAPDSDSSTNPQASAVSKEGFDNDTLAHS
jgi:hypothetical protein